MRKSTRVFLALIAVLVGLALWSILPIESKLLGPDGITLGLDLRGGSQLLYEADLSKRDPAISKQQAMSSVIDKIQRRVDQYGASEPVIQKQGTDRILVQLPGVEDINEAIELIGQTARLEFREVKLDKDGTPVRNEQGEYVFQDQPATAEGRDGKERELTGEYLKSARVDIGPTGQPTVAFEWNAEGAHLFEQVTARNLQKPLAIYLDDELISAPIVQSVIRNRGQIDFNRPVPMEEAQTLAIQLNSGALDVPLKIIDQRDVDASLGADSIRKSLLAAQIGVALLLLFMLIYYRLPGVVACASLAIYGVFLLAIFKVFNAHLTLTLPGIAAFILSLGMAVDANVLIFERLKEELRSGRTLAAAVDTGFSRAWTAIRDSNITTFIACIILFWLGNTFGAFMVRGFALTLFIGVAMSMFTAIVITRTFLRTIVASRTVTGVAAYGVKQ